MGQLARSDLARAGAAVVALLACAVSTAVAATEPAQPEVPDASPAERLVFMQPHLSNIRPPRTLRYAYVEEGGTSGTISELMSIELRAGAAGVCCDARGSFLSGPRALQLPEITEAKSNPALLYFLEYEVRRLQQQTNGQSAHFRQRIRLALAQDATITPTTIRWRGREAPAQLVRIAPFLDDPYRQRFEEMSKKEYAFVLSEAVPGGVFQVLATLPGTARRETLTLQETSDAASPAQ